MRKNKLMRAAAGLMVATLLTTSIISGTLAKYTTKVESSDEARVATWGFTESSIDLTKLFDKTYDGSVKSGNEEKVIAPGTSKSTTFDFTYNGQEAAPEVKYSFAVSTDGSAVDPFIEANKNITWSLDNGTYGTWDQLITNIKTLSGNANGTETYDAGTLPDKFNAKASNQHTIAWKWDFNKNATTNKEYWVKGTEVLTTAPADTTGYTAMTQDEYDTYMGNMTELDDVKVAITITATQID